MSMAAFGLSLANIQGPVLASLQRHGLFFTRYRADFRFALPDDSDRRIADGQHRC